MHRMIIGIAPLVAALVAVTGPSPLRGQELSKPKFITPPEQRDGNAAQQDQNDQAQDNQAQQDDAAAPESAAQARESRRQQARPSEGESRPRAVLGVQLQERDGQRVIVTAVRPEGAAAQAGVNRNDVLREIEGQTITRPRQVLNLLGQRAPGDEVSVTVLRDGEEQTMQVTLSEGAPLPRERQARNARRPADVSRDPDPQRRGQTRRGQTRRGQARRPASSQNRSAQEGGGTMADRPQSFELSGGWFGVAVEPGGEAIKGLRVKRVFPGGPAARAGIMRDDILLEIEGQSVSEHGDLAKALEGTEAGQRVSVVLTGGPDPQLHKQTKEVQLGKRSARNRTPIKESDGQDEQEAGRRSARHWEDSQGFSTQIPAGAYELEYQRRMAEQNERLERMLVNLHQEMQELRQEVAALKEGREGAASSVDATRPAATPESSPQTAPESPRNKGQQSP